MSIQYVPQVGEIYVDGVYIGYRSPATGEFVGVNGNTIVSDTPCADNNIQIINDIAQMINGEWQFIP